MLKMKISAAITALEACLEMFGDVPVKFVQTREGNPAIELTDVNTKKKPDVDMGHDEPTDAELDEIDAWLNSRFPHVPNNGQGLN